MSQDIPSLVISMFINDNKAQVDTAKLFGGNASFS